MEDLQLNPLVLSEEHAIAIATERSLFSLPLITENTDQLLPVSAILTKSTTPSDYRVSNNIRIETSSRDDSQQGLSIMALPYQVYQGENSSRNLLRGRNYL